MTKFSDEIRIQAIKLLVEGKTIRAVGRELGVSESVIRNWRNQYEAGGYDQLRATRQFYTAKFKMGAVTYRRGNKLSYAQAAADLGIPNEGTLYEWERRYKEQGVEGLQETRKGRQPTMQKENKKPKTPVTREQELEAENSQLKMENAYLKKLIALVEEREKSAKKTK